MLADVQIAADAARAIEASFPPEQSDKPGPGRPTVVPTTEQRVEVIRLRVANGRIGLRRIADLVNRRFPPDGERKNLGWRQVRDILADYDAASQKPR